MSASDAYGGAFFCLSCVRESESPAEALEWLVKAMWWRERARRARRIGQ